jgi:hypothetical protein
VALPNNVKLLIVNDTAVFYAYKSVHKNRTYSHLGLNQLHDPAPLSSVPNPSIPSPCPHPHVPAIKYNDNDDDDENHTYDATSLPCIFSFTHVLAAPGHVGLSLSPTDNVSEGMPQARSLRIPSLIHSLAAHFYFVGFAERGVCRMEKIERLNLDLLTDGPKEEHLSPCLQEWK